MNSKQRRQHKKKMERQAAKPKRLGKVEEIVLHNYQDNHTVEGKCPSGGRHNTDISLPCYVPRGCIELYKAAEVPNQYKAYLTMPDQVMEFGDVVQQGLVRCIALCDKPCDKLEFECKGYKYKLDDLRKYNEGLK